MNEYSKNDRHKNYSCISDPSANKKDNAFFYST